MLFSKSPSCYKCKIIQSLSNFSLLELFNNVVIGLFSQWKFLLLHRMRVWTLCLLRHQLLNRWVENKDLISYMRDSCLPPAVSFSNSMFRSNVFYFCNSSWDLVLRRTNFLTNTMPQTAYLQNTLLSSKVSLCTVSPVCFPQDNTFKATILLDFI